MTFYHFTFCRHLENILAEGLKPSPAGEGIWDSSFFWLTLPPDNVVWLTTTETAPAFFSELLCGDVNEGISMRVTVDLSPNSRASITGRRGCKSTSQMCSSHSITERLMKTVGANTGSTKA
jgi:hypothetical protein